MERFENKATIVSVFDNKEILSSEREKVGELSVLRSF